MTEQPLKPLFATIMSNGRWRIYLAPEKMTSVNSNKVIENYGTLSDLYNELEKLGVMVSLFDVYNISNTPTDWGDYVTEVTLRDDTGNPLYWKRYDLNNIKEIQFKPYDPISYAKFKRLFLEQRPNDIVFYGEDIKYDKFPKEFEKGDFIYNDPRGTQYYILNPLNNDGITEMILLAKDNYTDLFSEAESTNESIKASKNFRLVPLFDPEISVLPSEKERKDIKIVFEKFIMEAKKYKIIHDKLIKAIRESDEYKNAEKKYSYLPWHSLAKKLERFEKKIEHINIRSGAADLNEMLIRNNLHSLNNIEEMLKELIDFNKKYTENSTHNDLNSLKMNKPLKTPKGEVLPAPFDEPIRITTWMHAKDDPKHAVGTDQTYFTYDDVEKTFGNNLYLNATLINFKGKTTDDFLFINIEYSTKSHGNDWHKLEWYKSQMTNPVFKIGQKVLYNGKEVKIDEVRFGGRNPNTQETFDHWTYTLFPDGKGKDPYKGMIMISEKKLLEMQKENYNKAADEIDEDESDIDYSNLGDVEEELRRLTRWRNEYGSKGADGKIKFLEKRVEELKSRSKTPDQKNELLVSNFRELYNKSKPLLDKLQNQDWVKLAQARSVGIVNVEALEKKAFPNGKKMTSKDIEETIEEIEGATKVIETYLGSSKETEKKLSLDDLKASFEGGKLALKHLTGKDKENTQAWLDGLEIAIKHYN